MYRKGGEAQTGDLLVPGRCACFVLHSGLLWAGGEKTTTLKAMGCGSGYAHFLRVKPQVGAWPELWTEAKELAGKNHAPFGKGGVKGEVRGTFAGDSTRLPEEPSIRAVGFPNGQKGEKGRAGEGSERSRSRR